MSDERHCPTCKCPEHEEHERLTAPLRRMLDQIEADKKRWREMPGVCNECGSPTCSPDKICAACALY